MVPTPRFRGPFLRAGRLRRRTGAAIGAPAVILFAAALPAPFAAVASPHAQVAPEASNSDAALRAVLREYADRRGIVRDTPAEQHALAQWCRENGLEHESRTHLRRAVELDPDYAPAWIELGYVRVGEHWVAGRADDSGPPRREADPAKLAAAAQTQWYIRIRAIRLNMLESSIARSVAEGRERILQITDPLAIVPLSDVLSRGNLACREALVEALRQFPEGEATMNLGVLCITDPDAGVRRCATSELLRRGDPRVVAQLRKALNSRDDGIVRRAAEAAAVLRPPALVPDLIRELTAERRRLVEVPVSRLYPDWQALYGPQQVAGVIGPRPPQIGVAVPGSFVQIENEWRIRDVTVFRTEVLEALKAITGQNFGFSQPAWRRWHEENPR